MNYELKNEYLTVTISDIGAEVIAVHDADGYNYMWSGTRWTGRAPLLFPVCSHTHEYKYTYQGKEYEMGQHGFARKSTFAVKEANDGYIKFELRAGEDTKKSYPFEFTLTAEYTLTGRELKADFTVINENREVMPYMFGWHPAFALDAKAPIDTYAVDFGKECTVTNYSNFAVEGKDYLIKDGRVEISDELFKEHSVLAFLGSPKSAAVVGKETERRVDFSWGDNLTYACLWRLPYTDCNYICIEPWTQLPGDISVPTDFATKDMVRLAAGKSETYSYKVKFN